MTLPDAWDAGRPDYQGYVWYRLRFATPAVSDGALAVYLPYVSMNASVHVNGRMLGQQGRMVEPVTRHIYTPLLFNLPASALKPPGQLNELHEGVSLFVLLECLALAQFLQDLVSSWKLLA